MTDGAALVFGHFELRPGERRLYDSGRPVALGARAFDVLLALAQRAGSAVTRQELLEIVWPDRMVEESNLSVQISALRTVIGSDIITTLPGRGYCFTPARPADACDPPESGFAASVAPAPTGTRAQTNLPRELPAVLGRANDLMALDRMLREHRLVTVAGAGGIGKTLLVQHLLDRNRGRYPHGVCWVELGAMTDGASLPAAIAAALGVRPGAGDALARLAAVVSPLEVLVALDNAEHLVPDVAHVVTKLLDVAPGLRLVVTSQVALGLLPERVYRLGALAIPDAAAPVVQAREFGAVALFVERAQSADARFLLTAANVGAVIEVCRTLDGLPLAIELAAARAPTLGAHRIAELMRERFRLLTHSRNREAPARQKTLRAALEWSHGLLGEAERTVFRRLAAAAGSVSLELAQRLAADPAGTGTLDGWSVLDALCVLVDRSLVSVVAGDDVRRARFRLLDSPRAFALEQLVACGELEAVRQRHARAVATRFVEAGGELLAGDVGLERWTRELGSDIDNGREAFAWAVAAADGPLALGVAATLLRALPLSHHHERIALADAGAALLAQPVPDRLWLQTWVMMVPTWVNNLRGLRDSASTTRALALARRLDAESAHADADRRMLYFTLAAAAHVALSRQELAPAEALIAEARSIEDATWPAPSLVRGAEANAFVAKFRGDAAGYVRACRRTVELAVRAGVSDAMHLANLIDAELAAGDAPAAVRTGEALVERLSAGRDDYSLSMARLNLTAALLACGRTEPAAAVAAPGWARACLFGLQAYWCDYLALLAARAGRAADAALLAGCAQAAYGRQGELRETNEQAAADEVRALASAALGTDTCERLFEQGTAMRDDEVAARAFAQPGSPPWPESLSSARQPGRSVPR